MSLSPGVVPNTLAIRLTALPQYLGHPAGFKFGLNHIGGSISILGWLVGVVSYVVSGCTGWRGPPFKLQVWDFGTLKAAFQLL